MRDAAAGREGEHKKDDKIVIPEPTALSRVIETAIEAEPSYRRMYPDLYAHNVATAVEKFFSDRG